MCMIENNIESGKYNNTLPWGKQGERRAYHEEEARLTALFKKDCLAELGLVAHPKADLLFSKAWENGHASGYSDVLYWMQYLSDLIE